MSNPILLSPVLTEKSLQKSDLYVFKVKRSANRHQIKSAIEKIYKVEVKEVRTLLHKGKVKNVGKKRIKKRQPTVKKAYVVLSKGKIEEFFKDQNKQL
jgi:large subunit ribosomal protein L23